MTSTITHPRRSNTGPAAALIAALIAGTFLLAPATAVANHIAVYKCSASYTIEYMHTDARVPAGPVPFTFNRGNCQKFTKKAVYYMVDDGTPARYFIYLDARNKVFGRTDRWSYDCRNNIELKGNKKVCQYTTGCEQISVNVNFPTTDGQRCEVFCETGTFPPPGNTLKHPIFGGISYRYPLRLVGVSCRVTCYTNNFVYLEPNLGKKDYTYDSFSSGTGIACVTGKISCTLDKKLTLEAFTLNDGVAAVENLLSLKYVNVGNQSRSFVRQFLQFTPAGVPFLP